MPEKKKKKKGVPECWEAPLFIEVLVAQKISQVCLKIIEVMFGNGFCFLFSKTCFWEYKEKTIFLYF